MSFQQACVLSQSARWPLVGACSAALPRFVFGQRQAVGRAAADGTRALRLAVELRAVA